MRDCPVLAIPLMAASLAYGARALADDPGPVPDGEMAALFSAFCLDGFPDPVALDRVAADQQAKPLAAADLDGPDRGWAVRTAQARYVVIAEPAPAPACTVRRMTPAGLSDLSGFGAVVSAYAARRNATLSELAPQKSRTRQGIDVSAYGSGLRNAIGRMIETFGVLLVNYHGHLPERWRDEAGAGEGIEIRMIHQLTAR